MKQGKLVGARQRTGMRSPHVMASACLIALLSFAGCSSGDDSIDSPKANPHPAQRVKVYVSIPPTLNVRIGASYRLGTLLGMFGGGSKYCGPEEQAPPGAK